MDSVTHLDSTSNPKPIVYPLPEGAPDRCGICGFSTHGHATGTVYVDSVARLHAETVLGAIRETVPGANMADAYQGALRFGIDPRSLCDATAETFRVICCDEAELVAVLIEPSDLKEATDCAARIGVPVRDVLGASLCSGLAAMTMKRPPFRVGATRLAGVELNHGPFAPVEVSHG